MKSAGKVGYDWREDRTGVEDDMLLTRRNIPLLEVGGRAMCRMKEVRRESHVLKKLSTL